MSQSSQQNLNYPKAIAMHSPYLHELIEKISPHLHFDTYPIGQRFTLSSSRDSKCYFIRTGAISLYRQPNDVLLELLDAPSIRGIIPIPPESTSIYTLKVIIPADIAILDIGRLYELLGELNLWETFSRYLQVMSSILGEVIFKLVVPSAYDSVRIQLYELMAKPETVRERILVENYIRDKTKISRSRIMRILSDLKAGGYILMEKGILKDIINIPLKY
jgi:CRP-like cAMP-binding protein